MKKRMFFLLSLFLWIVLLVPGQADARQTDIAGRDNQVNKIDSQPQTKTTPGQTASQSSDRNKGDSSVGKPCPKGCKITPETMGGMRWFLILLPVILLFVIGGLFLFLILRGKFDLSETLSTGQTRTVETVHRLAGNEEKLEVSQKPVGSTSRLIAFFTSLIALLIAICLMTYYAYYSIAECDGALQFEGLWKILAGLGIGVIPYGINVWRGNQKEHNDNNTPNNSQKP